MPLKFNGTTASRTLAIQVPIASPPAIHDLSRGCLEDYQRGHFGQCHPLRFHAGLDSKTLKYAVYSNVAIQLGKDVRVVSDIASTTPAPARAHHRVFSDFHYLPNMSQMENDLANLRGLLNFHYDTSFANRISTSNTAAVNAAASAGLTDLNHGYIDDMNVALKNLDSNRDNQISSGEFVNPNTGQSYDPDLFTEIER